MYWLITWVLSTYKIVNKTPNCDKTINHPRRNCIYSVWLYVVKSVLFVFTPGFIVGDFFVWKQIIFVMALFSTVTLKRMLTAQFVYGRGRTRRISPRAWAAVDLSRLSNAVSPVAKLRTLTLIYVTPCMQMMCTHKGRERW